MERKKKEIYCLFLSYIPTYGRFVKCCFERILNNYFEARARTINGRGGKEGQKEKERSILLLIYTLCRMMVVTPRCTHEHLLTMTVWEFA
jgi:hypothetical protein